MAVVVNTHSEQEEKVLLAFLNSLNYDYQTTAEPSLTEEQSKEILNRDAKFANNETSSKPWSAIKQELKNVYR